MIHLLADPLQIGDVSGVVDLLRQVLLVLFKSSRLRLLKDELTVANGPFLDEGLIHLPDVCGVIIVPISESGRLESLLSDRRHLQSDRLALILIVTCIELPFLGLPIGELSTLCAHD